MCECMSRRAHRSQGEVPPLVPIRTGLQALELTPSRVQSASPAAVAVAPAAAAADVAAVAVAIAAAAAAAAAVGGLHFVVVSDGGRGHRTFVHASAAAAAAAAAAAGA